MTDRLTAHMHKGEDREMTDEQTVRWSEWAHRERKIID